MRRVAIMLVAVLLAAELLAPVCWWSWSARLVADESSSSVDKSGAEKNRIEKASGAKAADTSAKDKNAKNKFVAKVPGFTKEREAAALTFVRTHHPELADLLEQLRNNDRVEYRKAVVELFASSERLGQIQENNPARYDLELQLWKLTSRIHVLAARLAMETSAKSDTTTPATAATDQELRQALTEELHVRQQLVQLDRDKAAARLATLDKHLEQLRRNQDQQVEQRLQRVLTNAQSGLSAASITPAPPAKVK